MTSKYNWTWETKAFANEIVRILSELADGKWIIAENLSAKIGLKESSNTQNSKLRSIILAITKDWHIPIVSGNSGYKISENWDETSEYVKSLQIKRRALKEREDSVEYAHTIYHGKRGKSRVLDRFFKGINQKPKRISLLIKKGSLGNPFGK